MNTEALRRIRISAGEPKRQDSLDLTGLDLEEGDIPDELYDLTHLKSLNLSENKLKNLPESIGRLQNLVSLHASGNLITDLPDSLFTLKHLTTLDLAHNGLTGLPDRIQCLAELTVLDLAENQLSILPVGISCLRRLIELYLAGNKLSVLPTELKDCKGLQTIDVSRNDALALPIDIARSKNPLLVFDYLAATTEGMASPLSEARLIVTGRGGVGKSSIVQRLIHGTFDPNIPETTGVSLMNWTLNGPTAGGVLCHIWDFAGQTITHSLHTFFLSSRCIYLLVLTGRENLGMEDADYWLRMITASGSDEQGQGPPIIVLINKWEDPGAAKKGINRNVLRQRFPSIKAFVETDCKTGFGFEKLKHELISLANFLPWIRTPFPTAYRRVKDKLEEMVPPYISYIDYQKLCVEFGLLDDSRQRLLADHLHILGVALNFRNQQRLNNASILKPEWLTRHCYALLRQADDNGGTLRAEDLPTALPSETDPNIHRFLVEMMVQFELAFPLGDNDEGASEWLVPQSLPDDQPPGLDSLLLDLSASRLRFDYHRSLPPGVVARFIVRTHSLIEGNYRWASGVVLCRQNARALIQADFQARQIEITVVGDKRYRMELAGLIQRELRLINGDIPGLDVEEETAALGEWISVETLERDEAAHRPTGIPTPLGTRSIDPGKELNEFSAPDARNGSWKPKVFVSYSHKNERQRRELEIQLRLLSVHGVIFEKWDDRKILPGDDWDSAIKAELTVADVYIFLVSHEALVSAYIQSVEMHVAMERSMNGIARFIPIILETCAWNIPKFKGVQALPSDAKPITSWRRRSDGWNSVFEGLLRVFQEIQSERASDSPSDVH